MKINLNCIVNYKLKYKKKKILKHLFFIKFFTKFFNFKIFLKKKKKKTFVILSAPYKYKIAKHRLKLLFIEFKYTIYKSKINLFQWNGVVLEEIIMFFLNIQLNKIFLKKLEFFINLKNKANYIIT